MKKLYLISALIVGVILGGALFVQAAPRVNILGDYAVVGDGLTATTTADANFTASGTIAFPTLYTLDEPFVIIESDGTLTTTSTPAGAGGITSLNGSTSSTQTFAAASSSDTYSIGTSNGVHTLTIPNNLGWFTNDSGYITSTSTPEQIQDIAGGMFSGNTETLITATYQDGDGTIDLVVEDDLSQYSNATSGFITSAITSLNGLSDASQTFAGSYIGINSAGGVHTFTNNGVQTLTGTANQVNVSSSTGTITLSLPQDIHTGASPTFDSLTLTNDIAIGGEVNPGPLTIAGSATSTITGDGTDSYIGGNVGIGTTSPSYTLDINGDLRVNTSSTLGNVISGVWQATDVGISYGGTGASTASDARSNLGLSIGSDVQAWDDDLDDFAGLTPTKGDLITTAGTDWTDLAIGADGKVLTASSTAPNGLSWESVGGTGTVTSVDMSVPTGFSISGNPITDSGTLALAFDTGYSIVPTASSTNFQTAYDWGDWNGNIDISTDTNLTVGATGIELSDDDIALTGGYEITKTASSTNWNTAYNERGSQIGGSFLSWDGSELDVSDSWWNADADIAVDTIGESKINFSTACGAGNHLYISGNDLACEADDDTTYSASGTLLDLTGTTFSLNEGTLTDTKYCTYEAGTGIVCNSEGGAGGTEWTDDGDFLYPTETADDIVIGSDATSTAPFWFDVSENDMYLGSGGAGDSTVDFYASSTHKWTIGMDDDDGDNFKIATSDDFASGVIIDIDYSTGAITLGNLSSGFLKVDGSGVVSTSTIANSDLDNSTVSYGGIQLSLGGSDATPAFNLADATGLDFSAGTNATGGRSITLNGDAIDADAETYTDTYGFTLQNATSTGNPQGSQEISLASTITRFWCKTNGADVTLGADESTTDIFNGGSITCTSAGVTTTTFANAGLAQYNILNVEVDSVANSTTTVHGRFTVENSD